MQTTDNYKKHTSKNLVQRFLITNFLNTLIAVVNPEKIDSILDVGCGEGFTLQTLAENGVGKHLEGVDFLKTAIDIGKKRHPKLMLKQGDIYKLPYKENAFDIVICTEVLEHVDNPSKALLELKRVSNKYVLLSVPNEPVFMASNFLRGKNWRRLGNDREHINHWSTFSFQKFVKNHGLTIVKTKHPFPWTMLLLKK